jgi:5,10-methylenetetrahydromethanopterin reductase
VAEFWVLQKAHTLTMPEVARRLESEGWTGIAIGDNQNISGDWVVAATMAAVSTSRLRITTGVTNLVTRHPAVVAAAAFGVQAVSAGRMALGVGRGDSALAYLGFAPQTVDRFAESTRQLATLVRGGAISLAEAASFGGAPAIESVGYRGLPPEARISWVEPGTTLPLEVVGTGPKTISVGARYADRISFSVGADVDRLRWAMQWARDEAERYGRDPEEITFGAYVQAVCHPDARTATELGRGLIASQARYMALAGRAVMPLKEEDRAVIETAASRYDMSQHGQSFTQADAIDDEFAQRFSIFGPPEYCAERFGQILDVGIGRIIVMPVRAGTDAEQTESLGRIAHDVLPTFDVATS